MTSGYRPVEAGEPDRTAETTLARGAGGMMLTVVTALGIEAAVARRALPGVPVVRVGVGGWRARTAARRQPVPSQPVAIAGLCGGLDAAMAVGDIVVASELRGAGRSLPCAWNGPLVAALEGLGLHPWEGPLVSVGRLVLGRARQRLRATGTIAVDMESAWLAQWLGARPVTVLRVVVDSPSQELLRPGLVRNGPQALRALARAAPALATWATAVAATPVTGTPGPDPDPDPDPDEEA